MTVQCLYQNDPKDAAAVLGQRNACRRAANKLGWLIQQERICDASEGTPLLLRPDVQELLRDVEQGRFQVLVVASAEVLQCPEGEWESLLAVLQKGRVRTLAGRWILQDPAGASAAGRAEGGAVLPGVHQGAGRPQRHPHAENQVPQVRPAAGLAGGDGEGRERNLRLQGVRQQAGCDPGAAAGGGQRQL